MEQRSLFFYSFHPPNYSILLLLANSMISELFVEISFLSNNFNGRRSFTATMIKIETFLIREEKGDSTRQVSPENENDGGRNRRQFGTRRRGNDERAARDLRQVRACTLPFYSHPSHKQNQNPVSTIHLRIGEFLRSSSLNFTPFLSEIRFDFFSAASITQDRTGEKRPREHL